MSDNSRISLAPLQGFTDRIYRKLFAKHFHGVDEFYVPYIEFRNDGSIKRQHQRDVQTIEGLHQVPQVLCNNAEHLIGLANYLKDITYTEANWNLGCPYPMVAKRKKGSGLLPYPEEIKEVLSSWYENPPLELTIKLRLGYIDETEIDGLLEVLNQFDIKEIILHPRIGKQLYKGKADAQAFGSAQKKSRNPMTYNGDIDSVEKFNLLKEQFPNTQHWMIGRGLLSNPFLAEEIKGIVSSPEIKKEKRIRDFAENLWDEYEEQYGHPSQALTKMTQQWSYLCNCFNNPHKVFKAIKKSKSPTHYRDALGMVFREFGVK